MTDGAYDYDVVTYTATGQAPNSYYAGWHDPWWFGGYYPYYGPRLGFRATIGFGRGRRWR